MMGAHIRFPGWPDSTLELGWWSTWDGTSFHKVCTLQAGELCIIHQWGIRDTTVKTLAANILVPAARGTSEENLFLETEKLRMSKSHIMDIGIISWLWKSPGGHLSSCPFLRLTGSVQLQGDTNGRNLFVLKTLGHCSPKPCLRLSFPCSDPSIFRLCPTWSGPRISILLLTLKYLLWDLGTNWKGQERGSPGILFSLFSSEGMATD